MLEVFMTEKSIADGFQTVFGVRCDVISKLIYMRGSHNLDQCRLSISDFYRVFSQFVNDIPDKRVKAVFDFLDLQGNGYLNIVTLIQIYVKLPDRCLLKFEMLHLLKEYKRQISHGNPLAADYVSINYILFKRILPSPSLLPAIQYWLFGYTLPVKSDESHLQEPLNPFLPFPT